MHFDSIDTDLVKVFAKV